MSWDITAATVIGGGAAAISGALAVVAWRHRSEQVALPFMGLMLALATWSLLYGVQLGYGTLAEQLVVQRLTIGVAGFVPTFWLIFALAYAGYDAWLEPRRLLVLVAEPVAFLLLCLSNPMHGLVWSNATVTTTAVGLVPVLSFGVGYVVHIAYAYAAVASGLILLVVLGTRVSPMYQRQVVLLVTGALPPFLSHIAFTLGASPVTGLDLTPFVFAFTGIVFGLALFRFELLELTPVARSQSLEEMGDGLVVIDDRGVIVDLFGVAPAVLEPTPGVGDPIGSVFPDTPLAELDGTHRTATVDGRRRTYQLLVSRLTDHHDRQTGTMLMIRDVTGLHESEQRLRVSDRVLRHNLRNDMAIVQGYASALEENLEGSAAADARQIRETAEGLIDLSEKARRITSLTAGTGSGATEVDVVEQIRPVITAIGEEYPGVEVRTDLPSVARIPVRDAELFRTALRNVVENAFEHNDARDPYVAVTTTRTGSSVRIQVADNGPGIPELERTVFDGGMETPLDHGQGLGLWLAYWCVSMLDGDLDFVSGDDGTTVVLEFPDGSAAG